MRSKNLFNVLNLLAQVPSLNYFCINTVSFCRSIDDVTPPTSLALRPRDVGRKRLWIRIFNTILAHRFHSLSREPGLCLGRGTKIRKIRWERYALLVREFTFQRLNFLDNISTGLIRAVGFPFMRDWPTADHLPRLIAFYEFHELYRFVEIRVILLFEGSSRPELGDFAQVELTVVPLFRLNDETSLNQDCVHTLVNLLRQFELLFSKIILNDRTVFRNVRGLLRDELSVYGAIIIRVGKSVFT